MNRLLVIGAGASLEECKRSGNYPENTDHYMPVISNFCNKLFIPDSGILLRSTASYLNSHGISYETKLLNLKDGDTFTGEDMERSPIGVFLQLERDTPGEHNIERLCEYVWRAFKTDTNFWDSFIYDGIYLHLFALFTNQFGLGLGKPMRAGTRVANQLTPGDAVINLNYEITFDLALKQANKRICYAPDSNLDSISILKPHGSFNFYVNLENGNCFFDEPDRIAGSVGIPDPEGGHFYPHSGIVPPRLHKNYEQHPAASAILGTGRPFHPKVVTFWGLGLTDSDIDLLSVYKEATSGAETIEFINPSSEAYNKAIALLDNKITHYQTLDEWFIAHNID